LAAHQLSLTSYAGQTTKKAVTDRQKESELSNPKRDPELDVLLPAEEQPHNQKISRNVLE
jgi:hypothetical protein